MCPQHCNISTPEDLPKAQFLDGFSFRSACVLSKIWCLMPSHGSTYLFIFKSHLQADDSRTPFSRPALFPEFRLVYSALSSLSLFTCLMCPSDLVLPNPSCQYPLLICPIATSPNSICLSHRLAHFCFGKSKCQPLNCSEQKPWSPWLASNPSANPISSPFKIHPNLTTSRPLHCYPLGLNHHHLSCRFMR